MTGQEGPSAGRPDIVRQLADYVIRNFYSQVHTDQRMLSALHSLFLPLNTTVVHM